MIQSHLGYLHRKAESEVSCRQADMRSTDAICHLAGTRIGKGIAWVCKSLTMQRGAAGASAVGLHKLRQTPTAAFHHMLVQDFFTTKSYQHVATWPQDLQITAYNVQSGRAEQSSHSAVWKICIQCRRSYANASDSLLCTANLRLPLGLWP